MTQLARRPAMTDVARLAGVSHQTVSRVLNQHPSVSARTRTRVQAAMDQLGYRPNRAARALVTGRTGLVGAVAVGRTQYGPSAIVVALEEAAWRSGYDLAVVSAQSPGVEAVREAVDRLQQQGVDGLVVLAPFTTQQEVVSGAAGTPMVVVEGPATPGTPAVYVDQRQGAALAVEHLLGLGHRTVWHVAGPTPWWEAREREIGWRETLVAAGHPTPPLLSGDWTAASGFEAGRVIASVPEVTAVFSGNDQMAVGLIAALRQAGRRVPEDVSVVGFDDVPESPFCAPALTTIRQDFHELGLRAMRLLDQALTAASGPPDRAAPALPDEIVPAELVVRASTSRPSDRT